MCVVCLKRFHSHSQLGKHFKIEHKANAKEITAEFQDAKAKFDSDPQDEVKAHNKKIALMKVTMLEKF